MIIAAAEAVSTDTATGVSMDTATGFSMDAAKAVSTDAASAASKNAAKGGNSVSRMGILTQKKTLEETLFLSADVCISLKLQN